MILCTEPSFKESEPKPAPPAYAEDYIQISNKSTIFKFENFKQETGKNISNEWLEWFIGFYEGDGTIISRDKGFTFCIYSILP
jgi:hypothetical protein